MTENKGPLTGTYVPIELPWKGATSNEPQLVSMKDTVAKWLNFNIADNKAIEYKVKVNVKGGSKTITRRRRPGKSSSAIRVEFGKDGNGNPVEKKIAGKSVESVQFPVTKSVSIHEIVNYFETGKGKNLGVKRVVNLASNTGYPIRNSS